MVATRLSTLTNLIDDRGRATCAFVDEKVHNWDRASPFGNTQIMTGKPSWAQRTVTVTAPSRGCHLITSEIVRQMPELREFKVGMANVFLKHTSASITLNENVRRECWREIYAFFLWGGLRMRYFGLGSVRDG